MRPLTPAERDELLALVTTAREATFEATLLIDRAAQPYISETPSQARAALRSGQLAELDAYDAITRWVCDRTADPSPLELILNDPTDSEGVNA